MKIAITRRIPQICISILEDEGFEVISNQNDYEMNKGDLIDFIKGADGAITSLVDRIDLEVMEKSPGTKIYSNFAVGFNNFDILEAKRLGITLTNTPDVLSDTTAETAWALIFAVARRSVEADRFLRSGKWTSFKSDLMLGQDVHGKTLGLIGAGRIGKKVAKKSKGFDMPVIYHNRSRDHEFEEQTGARFVSMDELIRESDIISVHVPFTPDTYKMISEREFKNMKKNAIFINTGRGQVVDEEALARALRENWIYGAGLDVYENEPHVNRDLLKLDNAVLFPHIGSASVETRNTMAELCARNMIEFFKNGKALTPIA